MKAIGAGCGCTIVLMLASGCLLGTVFSDYGDQINPDTLLFAGGGLWLVFSAMTIAGGYLKDRDDNAPGDSHGTAGFANNHELAARGLLADRGLVCGRSLGSGELIRFDEAGHLLTVAPTRSGKGVGAVIPNALKHPGSMVIIDPKGENAAVTARARREMGQEVYVLDPFDLVDEPSAQFNPLDFIRTGTIDAAEDADLVAEMLAETEGEASASSSHFEETARVLMRAVILYVAETADERDRHLGEVRRRLTLPPEEFEAFLDEMSDSDVSHGSCARAANTIRSMADRERSGVISTARRHTDWLESPRFIEALERSDFDLEDIKRRPTTVYLVLPPSKLERYRDFNRLAVGLSLAALQRDAYTKPDERIVYLLDEIAQLGHLSPLEQAVGVAAGYGITLWQFWQDLSQLRSIYGDRWESFVSNAAVFQIFGVADKATAEYVSDLTGQTTVQTVSKNQGISAQGAGGSIGHSDATTVGETGRALLTADEVRRLDNDKQLLFKTGCRPALTRKVRYFEDPEFAGIFDDNPMYDGN